MLKNADVLNRSYAKAFGVYATPPALCVVNAKDTEEVSKVLSYCNDQLISVIPRTALPAARLCWKPSTIPPFSWMVL